jgi:hypothetical protein
LSVGFKHDGISAAALAAADSLSLTFISSRSAALFQQPSRPTNYWWADLSKHVNGQKQRHQQRHWRGVI